MRCAEHHIKLSHTGRYNYRLKYMVIGDYIKIPDWDKYPSVTGTARRFAKQHPGWDFHTGILEDGTPVLWRIA